MDPQFLNSRVLKSFRHVALRDLPEAPVHAIRGLSETDAQLLYDSFYVKTIRDLADLKYVRWAQEICALRDVPQEKIDMSSFADKLIKAYEQTPIRRLMKSPVHALQGLSEADGKRLDQAFRVRTIQNLARLKFARYAHEICREAYADLSAPIRPGDPGGPLPPAPVDATEGRPRISRRMLVLTTVLALAVALVVLIVLGVQVLKRSPGTPDATRSLSSGESRPGGPPTKPSAQSLEQERANVAGRMDGKKPSEKVYVVEFQDSLFGISKRLYGTPARWPEIYRLNQSAVKDPHRIFPGTKLRLP